MTLDLFAPPSTAVFSRCERYRYHLTRSWGPGPRACFVMLNPSTATAEVDDPTIRKCIGFARRWGCGSIDVVNLWAIRSTDPAGVLAVDEPVGVGNDAAIEAAVERSTIVVFAWGAHVNGLLKRVGWQRVHQVREMVAHLGVRAHCLGTSADGSPRHPLYVPYETDLVPWVPPGGDA